MHAPWYQYTLGLLHAYSHSTRPVDTCRLPCVLQCIDVQTARSTLTYMVLDSQWYYSSSVTVFPYSSIYVYFIVAVSVS